MNARSILPPPDGRPLPPALRVLARHYARAAPAVAAVTRAVEAVARDRRVRLAVSGLGQAGWFVVVFLLCLPMPPALPRPGLDPSWVLGLSEATQRGWTFGTDIVLTYGPYHFLSTKLLGHGVDGRLAAVTVIWTLACSLCWFSWVRRALHPVLAYPLTVATLMLLTSVSQDAWFSSCVLVAYLSATRLIAAGVYPARVIALEVVPLVLVFTLPFYVKGSFGFCAVALVVALAAQLAMRRQWRYLLVGVGLVLVSWLGLWIAARQALGGLPFYVSRLFIMSAGYSDAMSVMGSVDQIKHTYVAFALVLAVLWQYRKRIDSGYFVLAGCALTFYLGGKSSFTRHDGHALAAAGLLLFAGTWLLAYFSSGLSRVAAMVSVWAAFDLFNVHGPTMPVRLLTDVSGRFTAHATGLRSLVTDRPALVAPAQAALAGIRTRFPLPALKGTVDMYGIRQAELIAQGMNWKPRPVFQSYAAFTPALAELNRASLLANRPDHLLFMIEAIDNRYPALEDGPSWPEILARYRVESVSAQTGALLKALPAAEFAAARPIFIPAGKVVGELGKDLPLPAGDEPIYARISIVPSGKGRFWMLGGKRGELTITVKYAGGEKRHRFIPPLGRTGFLLSPYIADAAAFAVLANQPSTTTARTPKVDSLRIEDWVGQRRTWATRYEVEFFKLRIESGAPVDPAETARVQRLARIEPLASDVPGLSGRAALKAIPKVGLAVDAHPTTTYLVQTREAKKLTRLCFGLSPDVVAGNSDGVRFEVLAETSTRQESLLKRLVTAPGGERPTCLDKPLALPADTQRVLLRTSPNADQRWDWAYWSDVALE